MKTKSRIYATVGAVLLTIGIGAIVAAPFTTWFLLAVAVVACTAFDYCAYQAYKHNEKSVDYSKTNLSANARLA